MTREEAIEKVRQMSLPKETMEILEALAPQLKESEDERIKKALIEALTISKSIGELKFRLPEPTREECIAWLEKQKENPMPNSTELIEMWDKEEVKLKEKDFHGDEWRLAQNAFMDGFAIGTCVKFEKQKEQPTNEEMLRILRTEYEKGVTDTITKYEQKEPKPEHFELKAGKWYFCHHAFCCRADLLTVQEGERFMCEKDGVVKGFMIKEPEKYFIECSAPAPMEDEQKEQKPAEWSEDWREEDIQTRFAFYTYKDDPSVLYLSNVFVEETSRNHGFGTRILRAAEKVAETIGATTISLKVKQDSPANTWYRKNGYGYVTFEDGYDWLEKNLEYMKPNKQEWSEEDEDKLKQCIRIVKGWEGDYDIVKSPYSNFLKSLRLQPHWKPSKEEIDAFENLLKGEFPNKIFPGTTLANLLNKLKKLYYNEAIQVWKPSEEQMEALRVSNSYWRGLTKEVPKTNELKSLYNDLQKL